jgi:hypothetical protein
MSSELNPEIQRHVIQYLNGTVSLAEFENWFVPILWDIDDEDERTRELAGTVHVLISEFSSGGRTLASLRENLAAAIRIPVSDHKPAFEH